MKTAKTVKFYVDQCDVVQGGERMSIIKNNCYARAINTTFLSGASHLVSSISEFSYSKRVINI